jgi:phosphoglucomutase
VDYLFRHREQWRADAAVGKTVVSTAMIDRVAKRLGRRLYEVPVGFKWYVSGLLDGSLGFGGEESAGASFLRRDGSVWTTDKDGLIAGLLAAEMTARSGVDPGTSYERITRSLGAPFYERIDAPATADQRSRLKTLSADEVGVAELAGEKVIATYTRAPGNNASIGGIKIVTQNGWFALRPSGTEDVYKIYAESFQSEDHLHAIQAAAQDVAKEAFGAM